MVITKKKEGGEERREMGNCLGGGRGKRMKGKARKEVLFVYFLNLGEGGEGGRERGYERRA